MRVTHELMKVLCLFIRLTCHCLSGTAALEEDAQILKVIEAYCTSAKTRQTLNSSVCTHIIVIITANHCLFSAVSSNSVFLSPLFLCLLSSSSKLH